MSKSVCNLEKEGLFRISLSKGYCLVLEMVDNVFVEYNKE